MTDRLPDYTPGEHIAGEPGKIQLHITDDEWENAGADTDDPASTLLTTIIINGTPMHLEAIAVLPPDEHGIVRAAGDRDDDLAAIHGAVGADGGWTQTTIRGREYVLIATPHCQ